MTLVKNILYTVTVENILKFTYTTKIVANTTRTG